MVNGVQMRIGVDHLNFINKHIRISCQLKYFKLVINILFFQFILVFSVSCQGVMANCFNYPSKNRHKNPFQIISKTFQCNIPYIGNKELTKNRMQGKKYIHKIQTVNLNPSSGAAIINCN